MAGMKKYAKKAGRAVEKKVFGSKGFKGRYGIGKGKGGFNFMQVAKDLAMVKSRLNVEKKHKDIDIDTINVGQVNINADGARILDLTAPISQGIDSYERIGNSIKITGMSIPLSICQQVHCLGDRKLRITLLRVNAQDNGVSGTEAFEGVWDVNPLTTVRDYDCPRRYRNSRNDGISVVRSKVLTLKGPQLDSGTGGIEATERNVLNFRFNVKLNDTWRYLNGTATVPQGVKYYLVFQVNAGNVDASTLSTLDVPVKSADSGVVVRCAQRIWFVDN